MFLDFGYLAFLLLAVWDSRSIEDGGCALVSEASRRLTLNNPETRNLPLPTGERVSLLERIFVVAACAGFAAWAVLPAAPGLRARRFRKPEDASRLVLDLFLTFSSTAVMCGGGAGGGGLCLFPDSV